MTHTSNKKEISNKKKHIRTPNYSIEIETYADTKNATFKPHNIYNESRHFPESHFNKRKKNGPLLGFSIVTKSPPNVD